MSNPALIVMAAGIGSRYGGLKQIDPVGPSGELLIDYAVYDALRAGFERVVFLISPSIEEAFRERIGQAIEKRADVVYAFQTLDVPAGFMVPLTRTKPWGTAHAVLACRDVVATPFAVINADDYYGATAFRALAQYLRDAHDREGVYDYCMVGYVLSNTLSEYGHVARGVCQVTPDDYLIDVRERTHIEAFEAGVKYTENGQDWIALASESIVSMNTWGFTPSIFAELAARFPQFLIDNAANVQKAEYFLPDVVGNLVHENRARVKVLPTTEKWFGMTYRADHARAQQAIRELVSQGVYPAKLWSDAEIR